MSDTDRDILRAIAVLIDDHERGAQEFRTEMDPVAEAIRAALGDLYAELRPTPPDPAEAEKIAASLSRSQRIGLRQIARGAPNYRQGFSPASKIGKTTLDKLVKNALLETREINADTVSRYQGYRPTRLGSVIAEMIEKTLHQDLSETQRAALRTIADRSETYRSGIVPAGRHTGLSHSAGRGLDGLGLVRSHSFPHNGFSITETGRRVLTRYTEHLLQLSAEIKEQQS